MGEQIFLSGITLEDFISRLKEELATSPAPQPLTEAKEDEFLTAKQVSKILGVSLVTIHAWKKAEKIKFHRFGSRIRFKKSEILGVKKFQ